MRINVKKLIYHVLVTLCGMSSMASVFAGTSMLFVHSDHLGTPQVLTDANQTVVWRADYQPFGQAEINEDPDGDGVAVDMPLRFPGQYFDKETGMHYNYYRDYDPSLGRYIQSDPIGLEGGINTYAYVEGNPLIYTDSFGLINDNSRYTGLPSSQTDNYREFHNDKRGAELDFVRNYYDMRDANTIGADQYFHCKANCEATQRGPGGELAACQISDTREWFDQNIKRDPASASAADQIANQHGRNNANQSQNCTQVCAPFRPNGLPQQY